MSRSGPHRSGSNRRVFVTAVLIIALLSAANPIVLVSHIGQQETVSTPTPGLSQVTQVPCGGQCTLPGGLSLASIFPFAGDRETPTRTNRERIDVGDDRAGAIFDALSSGTARDILARLLQEPHTAAELSEEMDTSLQNIHYHIENLRDADAVDELTVEYSSRGREMSVYTATCQPQILVYDVE